MRKNIYFRDTLSLHDEKNRENIKCTWLLLVLSCGDGGGFLKCPGDSIREEWS